MIINRRRLAAVIAAVAATMALPAVASAQDFDLDALDSEPILCNATILPGGVGGYDVSVAGRTVRVPKAEDFYVCANVSGTWVDGDPIKENPFCGSTCFDVFTPVSADDPRAFAQVCWTLEGVRDCAGGSAYVPVNVDRACVLSVGKPAQQDPSTCLVVIDEDPNLDQYLPL